MSTGTLRAALFLAVLLSACKSGLPTPRSHWSPNHWTIDSVPSRMVKHLTGYRRDMDGSYIEYQWRKKKDINLTLRRHFANNNPDNPFLPDDPSRVQRRPPHSPLPDPINYFHAESIAFGLITLGWSGAFIPIPVDSLVATIAGGWGEFFGGFADTFTGDTGEKAENPPGTSRFRVKNR